MIIHTIMHNILFKIQILFVFVIFLFYYALKLYKSIKITNEFIKF